MRLLANENLPADAVMALREGNPQLLRSCAEQAGRVVDGRVIEFDADDAANLIVRSAWEQLRAETP